MSKSEYLSGPQDSLPIHITDEVDAFLNNPGSIIDAKPQGYEHDTVYPNVLKNHAIIPLSVLSSRENESIPDEVDSGYLVENLATGLHYVLYRDEGSLGCEGIIDFKGTSENPFDIVLSSDEPERWKRSELDAHETRVGGIPLDSDGTPYTGLWPYLHDGTVLSFLAQYKLVDGRYIHIFIGHDLDEYDYSTMDSDSNEDLYTCAVIEGGTAPAWVEMRELETEDLPLVHPDDAYTLELSNSGILAAPLWIQDDYTPGNGEYEFLIQIGDTDDLDDEMNFTWGDAWDIYLFADLSTDSVKAIVQCS